MPVSNQISFEPLEIQRSLSDPGLLIAELHSLAKEKNRKGSVKKIVNTIKDTNYQVESWRFNEWDYSKCSLKLPTYSRGLFTMSNPDRIVCRGYDKFFSVGEVAQTQPIELKRYTVGPYYLTVKSNGCIVFISGLKDGVLAVCSKHSTGYRDDLSKNHALAAQRALELQLERHKIDKTAFAKLLYELNLTVVCEYCDDAFEEHVLEYKGEKSGLYLHGLNLNTVEFITYPMEKVDEFSFKFGFKRTQFHKLDTYDETIKFLEETSKTGIYNGEEIEGFVIRCKKVVDGESNDFLFKYKFEEPYLLYRELREVTKSYLKTKRLDQIHFGKHKHKLICMGYLKFVIPMFQQNPELEKQFEENKGVIALRKSYFAFKNTSAMEAVSTEIDSGELEEEMKELNMQLSMSPGHQTKYVLVTVATIGCGKTTTSLGLTNLYPNIIGHIQNDNIQRPVKDKLVSYGLEVLFDKPIVILDKNNHKFVERKQIFDDFDHLNNLLPRDHVKFICLNFLPRNNPKNDTDLWELTRDRIIQRSDNHQSIKVGTEGIQKAEAIMKGFISRFQPVNDKNLPDSLFDLIINLKVGENSSLDNLKTIDTKLRAYCKEIEWPEVNDDDYQRVFEEAKLYKPVVTKKMGKVVITQNKKLDSKKKKPYYFGIRVPHAKVLNLVRDSILSKSVEGVSLDSKNSTIGLTTLTELEGTKRIQDGFHITLIHSLQRKKSDELNKIWERYCEFASPMADTISKDLDFQANILLKRICSNDKVICVEVDILEILTKCGEKIELTSVNDHPHITIGTITGVKAVESNNLLNSVYESEEFRKDHSIDLQEGLTLKELPLFVHY